jgi:hypothetical protein
MDSFLVLACFGWIIVIARNYRIMEYNSSLLGEQLVSNLL